MKLVDIETGQLFENVKSIITEKQDDYFKSNRRMSEENRNFVNEYGNFIFKTDSKKVDKLQDKISDSDIAKLIYCATYLDYDNILHFDNGEPIDKKSLKQVISVNDKIFYKWYNLMIKNKILIEDGNNLTMNKSYCIKGKLTKNKNYNRMFIKAIRTIYEENTGKNMKTLGNILKMLPYINYKHNTLCWNPKEDIRENVQPITVGQLTNVLDEYKDNPKKFINQMSKYRVYDGQPVMLFFNDNAYLSDNYIMFNPLLTYSGKNEDLPEIYKMFVWLANKENSKSKGENGIKTSDINTLR